MRWWSTSTPTWSASSNGPIVNPARNRIAASIVLIGTPSLSWIQAACSKYGPRTRVVMNPGTSFLTTTTVLPNDFARSTAAWSVASLVVSARITSTSGISIAGEAELIAAALLPSVVRHAPFAVGHSGLAGDLTLHIVRDP